MTALDEPRTGVAHPLEPLTAEEVPAACAMLKEARDLGPSARFVFVHLHEPSKAALARPGRRCPARPRSCSTSAARRAYEAVVSLTDRTVVDWRARPGVQAPVMAEEFFATEDIVRADPRWQEAMRRRGITDLDLAMIDPWASSWTGPDDDPSARRIVRPLTWMRSAPGEHGYARPVDGLVVTVDLDAREVVEVEDFGIVDLPPHPANYEQPWIHDPANVPRVETIRDDVKPIEITQPEGP